MNSVGGNAVHRNPTGAQRWALASVLPLALAGCGGGSSNGDSTQADWFGTPILTDLGSAPRAIGFGDFNRDGRLDVAFTLATGALYVALCNGGDGSFVAPIAYVAAGPASTANSVGIADFNGDGRFDLVLVTPTGIAVLLGAR